MTWLCHRKCRHCYEDRFHPYYGEDLSRVVEESRINYPKVIANLPRRMTYRDLTRPLPGGGFEERPGRIILAGGEILLDAVRETVLYPALDALHEKYGDNGGVKLLVQTTGDLVTRKIVAELRARRVWTISVSGLDPYHEGLETEGAREKLKDKLRGIFESEGLEFFDSVAEKAGRPDDAGAYYHFFGATPDSWIGPLWPRGRTFENEVSTATIANNYCNGWSGGLNFLDYRHGGSEVSIEPNGNVYPCCVKTKLPLGSLLEEGLESILDRHVGNPVYEAISMGHPERMGIEHGWSVEKFLEKSVTRTPSGKEYRNLCVGCDRFHDEVLTNTPVQLVGIEP